MAEILIRAIDNFHPDPEKDRAGSWKRGYPVVVRPDGHEWGIKECLPGFVLLKIPGTSVDAVRHYISSWDFDVDYEVVASNEQGYRVRVFGQNVSASGQAALTKEQIETWLTNHGATVHSWGQNEVTFDLPTTDPVKLQRFRDELRDAVKRTYYRRQFYFPASAVDMIEDNGGVMEATAQQVLNYIKDRLDE